MFRHTLTPSTSFLSFRLEVCSYNMNKSNLLLQEVLSNLQGCSDLIIQPFQLGSLPCKLLYIASITNTQLLREAVTKPLLEEATRLQTDEQLLSRIKDEAFFTITNKTASAAKDVTDAIVAGEAAFYVAEQPHMRLFELKQYQSRSVPESTNEVVVIGPQQAFVEDIQVNMSLLRHIIKHPKLKTVKYEIGRYTRTTIYLTYIEGLCKPEVLKEITEKMDSFDMDSVLSINYLAEYMAGTPYSPFPQSQFSERPDSVASALMEGRVAILQDGTPFTLLLPTTFFAMMQSAEDYYQGFYPASWIRLVRLLFSIMSLLLPSMYVAMTTFHPEIIPTSLLLTIASARENIPFPALIEALIMELTFEGLREAGIRIPKPLGQTVSIIGGIVIGQAAVQAGIVSAPMVIVVSITGIASFIIPHFELSLTLRLLRFPILILGGTLGLIGIVMSLFITYWYMVNLRSFGIPYMQPLAPFVFQDLKDTLLRVPWFDMKRRPSSFTNTNQLKRRSSK